MNKLIITVAPTGNVPTKAKNPHLSVTPQEIADTAYRCWQLGASIVHIHARDDQGHPTLDPDVFARIYELISGRCDMIIQISTGGRAGMDLEARAAAVRHLRPEMASLTTGSMNFPNRVYENPFTTIEYLARAMHEAGTKPEMEIFEAGMIANAQLLVERGLATEPLHFNFVLGSPGSLPATPKNLLYLSELILPNASWTASGLGRWQLPMTTLALVMGGHVRVGLEDNLYYRRGELATNEQLVERVVRLADELGRPVATPDEARAIFHLTPSQHKSCD
jgi:3-keto-5-aminohexanoate cleavage enzyme